MGRTDLQLPPQAVEPLPYSEQAQALLSQTGWLVLELGYNMLGRVRALVGDAWTNVEITNDLRGIPRVLAAQKQ